MQAEGWDAFKVRKLTKKDYKLINKAVEHIQNEKLSLRFRDELKWVIIAILDEIDNLEDTMDLEKTRNEFDKAFQKPKPIALKPVKEETIYKPVDKDHTFKLMS